MELLYRTKYYSLEMPGTTVTKENGHTGSLDYLFRFSSLRRGPPRKMSSTLILGLDFFRENLQKSHPPELHQIFLFNTLFFNLNQKFLPHSASPRPGPALAIGYPTSLTPTIFQSTRVKIRPLLVH